MELRRKVLDEINTERDRQEVKWGQQDHQPERWLSILGEEFGEVCKAVCEASFPGYETTGDWSQYRKELIHVAAVACAMAECFDRRTEADEGFVGQIVDNAIKHVGSTPKKASWVDIHSKEMRDHLDRIAKRKAPWTDFSGKPIYEGDTIMHPDLTTGKVFYEENVTPDSYRWWRVRYTDGNDLPLGFQVGDKGMAIVVDPIDAQNKKAVAEAREVSKKYDAGSIQGDVKVVCKSPQELPAKEVDLCSIVEYLSMVKWAKKSPAVLLAVREAYLNAHASVVEVLKGVRL